MKNILITGGAGFIGSNLLEVLDNSNYKITIFDNFSEGKIRNLSNFKNIKIIKGSVTDRKLLEKSLKNIDTVIHLAAISSVPETFKRPIKSHDINVTGTINVFELAIKNNVKKVIFASSAAVYGDHTKMPVSENSQTKPLSPYGLHKLINEMYGDFYSKNSKTEFIALRFANVFGPKQDLPKDYPAFIPALLDAVSKNKIFTIYGDGQQIRDFIFVKDLVQIIRLFIDKKTSSGIFNVGTKKRYSLLQIIKMVEKIKKQKIILDKKPKRTGDIKEMVLDNSRLIKTFGKKVKFTDFQKALRETYQYFLKH